MTACGMAFVSCSRSARFLVPVRCSWPAPQPLKGFHWESTRNRRYSRGERINFCLQLRFTLDSPSSSRSRCNVSIIQFDFFILSSVLGENSVYEPIKDNRACNHFFRDKTPYLGSWRDRHCSLKKYKKRKKKKY